jgi:hypothetical protein
MKDIEKLIKILKKKKVWCQINMTEKEFEKALSISMEEEAKALVADCFRNNPKLEEIHSRNNISQDEMKEMMKYAVNRMYYWLWLKKKINFIYQKNLKLNGLIYSDSWDKPDIDVKKQLEKESEVSPMAVSWLISKYKYEK